MAAFQTIDAVGLQALKNADPITLLDVRTDAEVAKGVIEGATHIPLHLLAARFRELDSAAPVVCYCQSGARSAQACQFLVQQGHAEVYNLQGGVIGWQRAGKPLAAPGQG